MNQGTTVLAQIIAFLDYETFRGCVRRYDGELPRKKPDVLGTIPSNGIRTIDLSRKSP